MGFVHNVEISWDDLLNAFSNGTGDHVYFLDKMTGEIFFVSASLEDDFFWQKIEANQERFLEIPHLDPSGEKQIMSDFKASIKDADLKRLLDGFKTTRKPFGKLGEILEFFPEDQERFSELRDAFLGRRMKNWLEEHNLFTIEASSLAAALPWPL